MDTGAKGGNRMLKDLVKANRSYRGYDESRCVTKEELLEMADCARLAASSVNRKYSVLIFQKYHTLPCRLPRQGDMLF